MFPLPCLKLPTGANNNMRRRSTVFCAILVVTCVTSLTAMAQDINMQPKYEGLQKNDAQKLADENFIAGIDAFYKGNRRNACEDISDRGWELLRRGKIPDAMRRFNQAWMIENKCGKAIWGMAVVQARLGKIPSSLQLFDEAEPFLSQDLDFSVDYAKTVGIAGGLTKNEAILRDAFVRFESLYKKYPKHTLNLENWAITLFMIGNYVEAWKKVELAEATPRHDELDKKFIAALQSKMARPLMKN